MEQSIENILAMEIKQQIAERYFGFRKLIEEDIRDYDHQIFSSSLRLEQKIGFDLVRLYILLKDEAIIRDFFQSIGLQKLIFFDPYLMESPTIRKRVLTGVKVRGLTKKRRFTHLVLDTYESLVEHIGDYRKKRQNLIEDWENIAAEIKVFYQQNDLSTIMGFLRSLDGDAGYRSGSMEGGITPHAGVGLDNKMRVNPPPPVDQFLPDIPEIAPLSEVKSSLKIFINRAYEKQGRPDCRNIQQ